MVYRAAVKTGVIFTEARNKPRAREFVRFLLEEENLTPYVEGALGRWFPVTKPAQERPFWQEDPHRKAVYDQFKAGTVTFEFTKNYKFTILNNENVSAKAMNRVASEKGPVGPAAPMTAWQVWGLILIAPYLLVFLVFVLYPVAYGFWLARDPQTYVRLFDDPIFPRSVVNTLAFLILGINLKMMVALALSGFFVQARTWIRWLSLLFILPWAVPSIPTILSFRFMLNPEWGIINSIIFRLTGDDGPNWLNEPSLALTLAIVVHVWKSLPFWTLILISGRLAIPGELYEAASVDGASGWQKFRYVTWPSMQTLYLTCTILSM